MDQKACTYISIHGAYKCNKSQVIKPDQVDTKGLLEITVALIFFVITDQHV